jgi:Na+-translocating ferredoxin:NAD+ oxidoreductase RnfG subunit
MRHQSCRRFEFRIGILTLAVTAILGFVPANVVSAKVFASQKEALAEAFPKASRIDRRTMILRKKDAAKIAAITHEEVQARIVVLHAAYEDGELLGYAHIDVHNVRTKPEALMIVLSPTGTVRSVRMLAFHEPLDYLPTDRWYAQFVGKSSRDGLRVGRDVHGVVGATLSAQAAVDGVRRMLAYWEVLLRPAKVVTQAP